MADKEKETGMVLGLFSKLFGAAESKKIAGYTKAREVSGNRQFDLFGFESFITNNPKRYSEKNPRGHIIEGTELQFLGPEGNSHPLRFAETYDIVSSGDHVAVVLARVKVGSLPVLLANKTRGTIHFIKKHIGQVALITLLDGGGDITESEKYEALLTAESKEFARRGLGVPFN